VRGVSQRVKGVSGAGVAEGADAASRQAAAPPHWVCPTTTTTERKKVSLVSYDLGVCEVVGSEPAHHVLRRRCQRHMRGQTGRYRRVDGIGCQVAIRKEASK
jgi:hypothetical protein